MPSPAGKWNQHLHKACQQKEAWSALNLPGRCWVDCGLQKTPWTKTSRWHGSPNHHWLWKLYTGLQATWIMCLLTLPPDSGTLISKWNAKFTFIWKKDHFGPLSNSPVIFLFSPDKMLLTMFMFHRLSQVHWSSPKCLIRLCLTVFSSLWPSLLLVHIFLHNFFLPVNFAFNMLWHSTHWTAPLSVMTLCDLPSLWRESMIIFWTIVKSAVFPVILVSKNKRYSQFILYGWSFIETQM